MNGADTIQAAEVVLPCPELDATLAFFTERLGFRLEVIFPADDPRVAVVAGHGVRLRLERGAAGDPGVLRLVCRDPTAVGGGARLLTAPNGTRIELVAAEASPEMPALVPSLVVTRSADLGQWKQGRAGMLYRDLVPGRQGGRFIASHIRIPDGGEVPDYVHFHHVRFQMIHCLKGWVRVVYEDQGAPFVMHAGDSVLQPPQIRHRVLECSPGLEVLEIGCPAEHETRADHDLLLPTPTPRAERDFAGQRFAFHEVAGAVWRPWRLPGFEARDSGIAAATGGLAAVRVVRRCSREEARTCSHDAELLFLFVVTGALTLRCDGRDAERLGAGDSIAVPAGLRHRPTDCSDDVELLEVLLPATASFAM